MNGSVSWQLSASEHAMTYAYIYEWQWSDSVWHDYMHDMMQWLIWIKERLITWSLNMKIEHWILNKDVDHDIDNSIDNEIEH